ncbi:FAD-dependent monooxygenase [Vulcanisaeta distributa]|uniref:FAD-dependent pyridine nucleotide-disulfide oxidoreductase n=1 Tax=Vulcanisaeta distributa (strain DSM 14429 / JCM 11212 / NBRC 100878 / IC-017) TaxID=572478 RepID=E1QU95_VULDI|nr:NAD(P)/FAD-dependent oxidoreductase [Vulcanisaeta distributa]ADN51089.1 FAD-dependent pyridine nucleotide-disulfide oxidoreductase [Vulcanisaeta distributa DSM 14429]
MVVKTDVLIIGGGPAGSYLARYLVRNGFNGDVMLIDKKSVIYAPVICGELLPSEDLLKPWINRDLYDVLLTTLRETLRKEFIVNEIGWLRLVINGRDIARMPFRTYVIDKSAMIRGIIEDAINGGANVRFGITAVKCATKNGGYECLVHDKDGGECVISAKTLIGADAYPSIVDLSLGITRGFRAEDLIIATSARARGRYVDDEAVIVMDPGVAPGGFAWIFPRGDGSHNIGVGVRNNIAWRGGNPIDYHALFVSKYGLESTQRSVLMKTLPVGGLLNKYGAGNAYLIGDAVGSVIPTNGAGINPAMITAHLLGESMMLGYDYSSLMNRLFKPLMDRMVMFRRIGDPLLMNRDAMELAVKVSRSYMTSSIYEATLSSMRMSTLIKFLIGDLLIKFISKLS